MLIWASFRSHRCASVKPPLSFVRIAFNLWHCVHCESLLWPQCAHFKHDNVRPFSPIYFDDATQPPTPSSPHIRHSTSTIFCRKYLHAMAMWCDAHATSTLTLETFKTHFKMIFCNELRTRRWVVCVLCHSRRTRCSSHSTENY